MISSERIVMAKELVDYFHQQQIDISYVYARRIIAACPHSIRRRYVRAADAWSWWCMNPDFRAFPHRPLPPGETRGLAETG